MGTTAENRDAIYYLRTIRAGLGLVAQLRTGSEEEQMALIQAGADWISPVGASSDLLATLLLSLWNRRMPRSSPSVGARYSAQWRHGEWSLEDQAWTLMCPARIRVGLTSSERGLLMALFESPNLSAPYDALSAAINMAQNVPLAHNAHTRLGVLVSRLRSKCRRHGVDLPIRVLPNFGYMFVALEQSMSAR
jgi:DNA-binding response OmpR family regulator